MLRNALDIAGDVHASLPPDRLDTLEWRTHMAQFAHTLPETMMACETNRYFKNKKPEFLPDGVQTADPCKREKYDVPILKTRRLTLCREAKYICYENHT
jgi:hypothetical protein